MTATLIRRLIRRVTAVMLTCVAAGLLLVMLAPAGATAQNLDEALAAAGPEQAEQESLLAAVIRLPVAAALGAALAMRPRRAGTPPRRAAVIQTQVLLAVIGALVMMVVGVSLARAFGVVGIAGLIRYRAKIDDPKDAGVMLCALGVGLASGVGSLWLAGVATVFLLALLYVLESNEPEASVPFTLTVKLSHVGRLRRRLEALMRRERLEYELRSWAANELVYAVSVPIDRRTDVISKGIIELSGTDEEVGVEWEERKERR